MAAGARASVKRPALRLPGLRATQAHSISLALPSTSESRVILAVTARLVQCHDIVM